MEVEIVSLEDQLQATQRLLAELQSNQNIPATKPTLKLNNPPAFNGKASIHDWLFQVKKFLNGHKGVTEEQAVIYASALLKGRQQHGGEPKILIKKDSKH